MSAVSHAGQQPSKPIPGPTTIFPQHVTDPTILDSVAGFINEVVPTSYNPATDSQDQIQWAHFEHVNPQETPLSSPFDDEKLSPPTLLLVLGYTTGAQVWCVSANGEATELLSWRHGSVQVLRLLPAPCMVGKAPEDLFESKRPLMAICDTVTPGPQFCALNFLSLKTGEQVKQIKFKNPILDVLANQHSVVVTFTEKIAIFDAFTLEDRMTVTTCYMCPGIYSNPVALGTRWLAYAEKKLILNKRSGGGNESEGVQSYTATVLHAAKSLGRGLRELGETVASSLSRNSAYKSPGASGNTTQADVLQKGVITILDIERCATERVNKNNIHPEAVVAHFAAHTEAIVCLKFDPSGLLLLTADKRGHDFHLFRIHPHPGGPALAAVHHLYILHRGDTTARVQDMCFSADSRWVSVSTLRGTTHVFPVTPYGGTVCVRTHATPHVVNRMSRFHRSAGLAGDGRSNSPVLMISEAPVSSGYPYSNPRLPPYPHPTVVNPLAQIRQPVYLHSGIANSSARGHTGRQRNSSTSSDDSVQVVTRVSACFAPPRSWIDITNQTRDLTLNKQQVKPVESIFVVNSQGSLIQYDLDPHHVSNVPKEKVCDETSIELTVYAKLQWFLQRQAGSGEAQLPLSVESLGFLTVEPKEKSEVADDRWLSQVEIITHAGPHRRLWMGPQFTFKTYTSNGGSPLSVHEAQTTELGHSKPMNMPSNAAYPILIEAGSVSSCEQSPKFLDTFQRTMQETGGAGEVQLKEELAEAMLESPGVRDAGGRCVIVTMKPHTVAKVVNPLGTVVTVPNDDENTPVSFEDAVIHENCDEALFRPIVTPKTLVYAQPKHTESPKHNKKKNRTTSKINVAPDFSDVLDAPKLPPETNPPEQTMFSIEDEISAPLVVIEEKIPELLPQSKETLSSSEEEKPVTARKTRKPKPKLGVRIVRKDSEEEKKTPVDETIESVAPVRSWSSVAANKPEENSDLHPALLEFKYGQGYENLINLLKVDKSSDEEKVSNTTTESDDSSKWELNKIMMDTEEDVTPDSVAETNTAKPTKRKSKKKRK